MKALVPLTLWPILGWIGIFGESLHIHGHNLNGLEFVFHVLIGMALGPLAFLAYVYDLII